MNSEVLEVEICHSCRESPGTKCEKTMIFCVNVIFTSFISRLGKGQSDLLVRIAKHTYLSAPSIDGKTIVFTSHRVM